MYNKFTPLKDVSGDDFKRDLIGNSEDLEVGEVVVPDRNGETSVVDTGGGTTGDLLGVVAGIEGKNGEILEVDSYSAESDNVTVDMVQATYIPLYISREFGATLDADAGTTTGSSAYGNFAVDSTGLLLDESSYAAVGTKSSKQFFSFGLIPGTSRDVTGFFIATIVA